MALAKLFPRGLVFPLPAGRAAALGTGTECALRIFVWKMSIPSSHPGTGSGLWDCTPQCPRCHLAQHVLLPLDSAPQPSANASVLAQVGAFVLVYLDPQTAQA